MSYSQLRLCWENIWSGGSRHFHSFLLVALLVTLLSVPVSAQGKWVKPEKQSGSNIAEAAADLIIVPAMRQKQLPGLILGVVKDGQVVVKKGYGVKSFASEEAPDENTVFYIGSLSKALTAVGAMLLVEQGKLDLGCPSRQLPEGSAQKLAANNRQTVYGSPERDTSTELEVSDLQGDAEVGRGQAFEFCPWDEARIQQLQLCRHRKDHRSCQWNEIPEIHETEGLWPLTHGSHRISYFEPERSYRLQTR